MKATEEYFPVVLSIMLYKEDLWIKCYSVTNKPQMKAKYKEQYTLPRNYLLCFVLSTELIR